MATFGKKPEPKKKRLGVPPALEDVSGTLEAPEHAPAAPERKARAKTGRIVQFGTKVTPEFDERFRGIAFRAKLKHSELLEEMLEAYEKIK